MFVIHVYEYGAKFNICHISMWRAGQQAGILAGSGRQEPVVVLQELPNASLRFHFDTGSDEGPCVVEGVLQDAAQDPSVNAVHIRVLPEPVQGRDQEEVWVDLPRLLQRRQGLLHSLSKAMELRHVHQVRVRCHFLVLKTSPCSRHGRDARAGEKQQYLMQKPDRLCTSSESRSWLQVRDTDGSRWWASDWLY